MQVRAVRLATDIRFSPARADVGKGEVTVNNGHMADQPEIWDMWVDADGLTHGHVDDAAVGAAIERGRYIVVGDYDADPALAQIVDVTHDGVVLLRVVPGDAEHHRELLSPRPGA